MVHAGGARLCQGDYRQGGEEGAAKGRQEEVSCGSACLALV